ncbi:lasso peptide biosynthesis PqqD family chaperone [Spirillospora sp. CA-294931]|uniref:lasso peptide biosynthesis PqqD family chaperone n=1 Tax=Spirillospora sp. CA-294931 TaxID=3240042 RepID=UPI003D931E2A
MTLALPPDVTATDSDDGLVLLDQRAGRYWQLNRTGAATLRLLLDGHSAEQAAALLTRGRPEFTERARRDVESLLAKLTEARLVVTS